MSTSIAQKLAIIFGSGQTISAKHTEAKVIFSDKTTQLSFDQTDEVRQPPGLYKVTISESPAGEDGVEAPLTYTITQVFDSALPEAADKAEKTKAAPDIKQSPSGYLDDAPRRALR